MHVWIREKRKLLLFRMSLEPSIAPTVVECFDLATSCHIATREMCESYDVFQISCTLTCSPYVLLDGCQGRLTSFFSHFIFSSFGFGKQVSILIFFFWGTTSTSINVYTTTETATTTTLAPSTGDVQYSSIPTHLQTECQRMDELAVLFTRKSFV